MTYSKIRKTAKICWVCGVPKPLDEFYSNRCRPDGVGTACKPCSRSLRKQWSEKNKDWVIKRDRAYYKVNATHARKREAERKCAFPERTKAQAILRAALNNGTAIAQLCFVCGETAEGHHVSYDLPLDVSWLCRKHHKQTHAEAKNYL